MESGGDANHGDGEGDSIHGNGAGERPIRGKNCGGCSILGAKEMESGGAFDLFVSTIVHEIRNPLAAMQAAADVILEGGSDIPDEDRENYMQSVKAAVLRVTRIIDSALMLVKVRSNKVPFCPSKVNVARFCRKVANEVECLYADRLIIIEIVGPSPMDFQIDTNLMYHVVFNLMSNAVKYSDPPEPVTVKLSHGEGKLVIAVKDRGIGISSSDVASIFDLFHRGANIGKRSGIGIGMFIVKQCVAMHHGNIEVNSEENIGTTFKISIPV
jgi:signal transduction histidine kinase